MYKMMKRCLSLCLTLCILMMAMPSIGLSEDGAAATTPTAAETTPAAAETTPAATETTPAAAATTPAAAATTPAAAETTTAPAPVIVELTGAPETMEAMYGLYEDELDLPETLTAVYGDGAQAELPVSWVCISDGLGGTAYDGECENYEQACFTFEARLPEGVRCAEDLTLPRVQVRLVLPDLGITLYTAADEVTITNTNGVLSYTVPEGVTVKEQQWLKNTTDIAGATGTTYKLTMSDMKNSNNVLYVRLTLEDGSTVTSVGYAMSANDQWELDGETLRFNNDYAQNTTGFPIDYNGIGGSQLQVKVEQGVRVSGVTLTCNNLFNLGTITDSKLEITQALSNSGTIYGCEFSIFESTTVPSEGTLYVPVTINGTVYMSEPGGTLELRYGENTYEALKKWYVARYGTYDENCVLFLYDDEQNTRVYPWDEKTLGLSNSFNMLRCYVEAPNGLVSGATVNAKVDLPNDQYSIASYSWHVGSVDLGGESTAKLPDIEAGTTAVVRLQVNFELMRNGMLEPVPSLQASATFSGMAQAEGVLPVITNTNGVLSYSCTLPEGVTVKEQQWLKNGSPISGATGSSYTLTMDDMTDKTNVLSVRLILSNSTLATSDGYAMSENDEWELYGMNLAFTGSYDQKATDFPLNLAGIDLENVGVESGASVSGVNLSCSNLTNYGAVPNCTLQLMGNLANKGTISGSDLTVGESLDNYGTVSESSLTVSGSLCNSGVIYKSGIDCENVDNEGNGVIHVRVTIDGVDCSSTPDTSWQFLYGANARTALNAWYVQQHPGESTDDLRWVLADGGTPYHEVSDLELQYGLQYNFACLGTLNCSIEAPDGLLAGSAVRAKVEASKEYTAEYTWYYNGTVLTTGPEAVLPSLKPGETGVITLKAYFSRINGISVLVELWPSATFSGVAYDVTVDYEGDALVITPRDGVTIDGARVQVGTSAFDGAPVDGKCTLPLSYFGDGSFDASLYVFCEGKQLAGPTSLRLTRAAESVDPADFTVTVADAANADGSRNVTVRCANPDRYDAIRVGERIYAAAETVSCKVESGEDVTVYARTPGSDADEKLPSPWVEVGAVEASKWLYLNVSSMESLSMKTLYWGEWLLVKSSPNATLTWKINGEDVDAPTLNSYTYIIPAGVSSLSITATNETGSVTWSESGITSPLDVSLDYENEQLVLKTAEYCYPGLSVRSGSKSKYVDSTPVYWSLSEFGYPTDQENVLKLYVWSDASSFEIPVTIPARFAGSASYGSVSYDNPNQFDGELGMWQNITITTEDSDSVKYAAVKLVNAYGDVSCSRDGSGKWVPSIFGGLAGGQTYSIYARQYSVVNGVWTTFASDWFDTGVRITPGEIELSTYAPLVGDTVTATPKFNVPDQNVTWAWQYYLGADGTPSDITESNSFTIRPDSGYENRRLKVRLYYSTVIMGYAETEVIPAPELIVRREDGTELEKDARGDYIAYLGDKLTAEVANVSQSYLKDADVWFNWESMATGQNINDSSLTIDKGAFSEDFPWYLSVSLQNEALGDLRLDCFVRTHYAPAPEVKIDYENETLVAVKPDNEVLADYHLRVQSKDGDAPISKCENNVYTIPITHFSSVWPDGSAHELDAFWECAGNPNSDSMIVTIPARPAVEGLTFDLAAFAITVNDVSLADYEMKLVAMDGAVTDESVGSMVEDADNGNVRIEGLESSTIYRLWVQKKATDSAFRSEWKSFGVWSIAAIELAPSLDWTTTYDPTGFSLSAEDVLNHVTFAEKSTGLSVMFERGSVTLTRADGKPFPITDAGTYSLKLTLKGDPADYYELSTDTVTLTVQPYTVESFDFDSRKTYRGAAYDPYDFEVRVGERVLTEDDYTITVDGGATLRDAGTYTAHIAFKGSFASSLDGEVHPVIEPYTLRATASPLSREYDGTVSVECSADWDNCEPFAGDDVAVKASGTMADASAGSGKTVAIALALEGAQSGNYVLEGASLTGSVDIAKAKAPAFRLPAASRIVYGQALSESALTGGDDVGSFAWEDGSIVPPAGLNTCHVVLTPDDTDNYAWTQEVLVQAIEIIVEQRIANLTVENASKTYGDADPALKLSVTNVLDGDSLDYSISRREGEDVGQYAYSVAEGNNRNYKLNLLPGTLTIEPRSIADGSVSISAVSMQTYTGREIRPRPKLRFGDAVLVPGTDYVLSYSNNVKPGRATITITGKGNFSGSRSVNFTIEETAPAATATPAPSFAPISDEALQAYLNGMASLVFDAAYNPVDYEQIPVRVSGEAEENILLICASQEDDEPAQRSLILNAAQLVKLQQVLQENEIGDLIFENGSAAARMNLAELTGGNMAKLMALILSGGEITEEILQSDWSAMEDAALTEAEYERFSLEVRIVPVVQEDGEQGFEISVWLRCDALNLNVSDLIDSLCVMLDASRLVTAENAGTFDDLYAIARKNGEESELLDSALVLAPTVSEDGDAAESAAPMVTGRYALTALYAGEGMYRIVSVDV